MTQQVVKAVCRMTSLDAMVDNPSFTTHWEQRGSDTTVNLPRIVTNLTNFLNNSYTGTTTHSIANLISPVISRGSNDVTVEIYDITAHLDGSPAGSPIYVTTFGLGAESTGGDFGKALPEGIAIAVGYRVDYGSDVEFGTGTRPRARDRNRFYLGPLNAGAMVNSGSGTGRCTLAPAAYQTILAAFVDPAGLNPQGDGTADQTAMVVWTRAGAAVKAPITQVWVDDRFDYQRRRSDPGIKFTRGV